MVRPERLLGACAPRPFGTAVADAPASNLAGRPSSRTPRPPPAGVISHSCARVKENAGSEPAFSLTYGAPGEIRTPGLLVRSQALYPAELRAQISNSHWRRGRDCSQLRRSSLRFASGPPSRRRSGVSLPPQPTNSLQNPRLEPTPKDFPTSGGEGGIRTLEGLLTLTPLAGARLRPLGHLSGSRPNGPSRSAA